LEILTVCVLGLLSPCTAVKERLVGLVRITGRAEAVSTVRLTGIVTAVAPGAFTIIVVL
jgi:hypothetical protein